MPRRPTTISQLPTWVTLVLLMLLFVIAMALALGRLGKYDDATPADASAPWATRLAEV